MLNLFIDTNVLLNFFSFSRDHLGKLDELVSLIRRKEIRLLLPIQVVDEFQRKRESILKETIEHLEKLLPRVQSPPFCQEFDEMKQIQKSVDLARSLLDALIDTLRKRIASRDLHPDKLIGDLFKLASVIELTDEILHTAKSRFDRGNPPGKNNSYGDAINWESLLHACADNDDLYFVSGDKDFRSLLDKNQFSPYLADEWRSRKHSNLFYYELISQFTKDRFPQANISDADINEEKEISRIPPSVSAYSGYAGPLSPQISDYAKMVTCSNCGGQFQALLFLPGPYPGLGRYFTRTSCPHCGRVQLVDL